MVFYSHWYTWIAMDIKNCRMSIFVLICAGLFSWEQWRFSSSSQKSHWGSKSSKCDNIPGKVIQLVYPFNGVND